MHKLYLASGNPGKLREFREAAMDFGITVEPVPGIEHLPACTEDGDKFETNARKKALHYAAHTDGLVFADDSGICVDALAGAPGVYSARYSGPEATDATNNRKLLAELLCLEKLGTPSEDCGRTAHYVCVIALARAGEVLTVVEDRADGLIIDAPRGTGGFGYDPYFFFPPLGRTFAELAPEAKFQVSHRGKAFRKLVTYLRNWSPGQKRPRGNE
jgi:XTP/dITP diphosphohydrolase